jgi:hypothetical protein
MVPLFNLFFSSLRSFAFDLAAGLPDFSLYLQHTKTGKNISNNHKMTTKYTKRLRNRPNGHKIYRHLPLQDPPKFTQIGFFGLKKCHLATLLCGVDGCPTSGPNRF